MVGRKFLGLLLIACTLVRTPAANAEDSFRTQVSRLLPTESVDRQPFQLDSDARFFVFLFLGVECPVARQFGAKLPAIAEHFAGQPVQFIGVNSNPQDTQAEFEQYQRDMHITFAMIKDSSQQLAKRFAAKRTAEAVVVSAEGQVVYQGRIDDQFSPGVTRGETSSPDLLNAVDAALHSKPIPNPRTTPVGCLITFKRDAIEQPTTTFARDIAPLLWENCYECHRAGEIGPFDISDYEDLQGWAEMLVEVMEQGRMPPWHANPEHGNFKNQRLLPKGMIEVVRRWIDEGMPYGQPSDLPPKPTFVDGWRLEREPDLIVEMRDRPYRIPAEDTVEYQYFVVDPGFAEDRWVSSSQIIPGAPSVVHHAIVFIRPPDDGEFVGIGWLNAYVPGQKPVDYPEGYARKIPAGSKLVFQMHYTPSGTETLDITKIGINFVSPDKVDHQIYTTIAIDQDFEIPPQASNYVVKAEMHRVRPGSKLLAMSPHMHLRGKSFEVFAHRSDQVSTILQVPHYDFNWQHTYELAEPLNLDSIDSVSIAAAFDNSAANPFNPNPNEYVMWGDQTWEEMTLGYFDVAVPLTNANQQQQTATSQKPIAPETVSDTRQPSDFERQFVEQTLKRFDANHDGVIVRNETSGVFRDYSFPTIDVDSDGQITRQELSNVARGRRGG